MRVPSFLSGSEAGGGQDGILIHLALPCGEVLRTFVLRKLESFKQAIALNTLAWNERVLFCALVNKCVDV